MTRCPHSHLVLLPKEPRRLRCRHCHLTIKAEDLQDDYCPECYEADGIKRNDFETLTSSEKTQYRCEQCGAIIVYRPQSK